MILQITQAGCSSRIKLACYMFSLKHIKRGGERHVTKPLRAFKDHRKPMNDLAFYTIVNNMTAHGDTRDIFMLAP